MITKNRIALAALAAAGLAGQPALAHDYTWLEGGLVKINPDGPGDDLDGYQLSGSLAVHPNAHLFGRFADTDDLNRISLGGAYNRPLNQRIDLVLGGSLELADNDVDDDTGFGARGDLRIWLFGDERLELAPGLRLVDLYDDTELSARLGARYGLTPAWNLVAAAEIGDEADQLEAGVRYEFP